MKAGAWAMALCLWAGGPAPLAADGDGGSLDQHWLLRGVYDVLQEPPASVTVLSPITGEPVERVPLYAHTWDDAGLAMVRYYGAWNPGAGLRLEWNLLATAEGSSGGITPTAQPLGRSALLERQPYNEDGAQVEAVADQLNLRWQGDALNVVAGRQPVNFGQNFYFSPLDLFQPFTPQTTYRDFRPGVDALRATLSTGRFSEVEAVAVAGYAPGPEGTNATSQSLQLEGPQGEGSLLLRAQSGGDDWMVTALGGRFSTWSVGGASVQLEGLGSSWTLESLESVPLSDLSSLPVQDQSTLGWTRQWNSAVNTRVELSWQGNLVLKSNPNSPYWPGPLDTSRGLAAASATWRVSPLWTLTPILIWFGDDRQVLGMLDSAWSTGENSTLHVILEEPILFQAGGTPAQAPTETESLPGALSLDYRLEL